MFHTNLKVPTNLDNMLVDLQENMDKQGIRTTQKGVCNACQKPIVGQVITALGKCCFNSTIKHF